MKRKKEYSVVKFNSIREMLDMAKKEAGEKIAYRFERDGQVKNITYHEFSETTEALGASLCSYGFGKSHIAVISENRYEWIVTYLTVLKSAGVFVPIDKELTDDEKNFLLCESDAEVLFFSKKYENYVIENAGKLKNIKLFVCFDDTQTDKDNFITYSEIIKTGRLTDKSAYDGLKSDENEMKMLVFTSGTTGVAKGVMLTEHNLVSAVYYGLQVSHIYDVGLSVLPYNHTYESVCDILVSIHCHSTICICSGTRNVMKDMKLYSPQYILLVPAFAEFIYTNMWKAIKKQGKEKKFKKAIVLSNILRKIGIDKRKKFFSELTDNFGGRLQKIVCGGAPIRPEIGKFFDDMGIMLTGGYGITECSPLISVNDDETNDFNTAGFRVPCLEWKTDAPDNDGIGEICVKGDVVMKGYYKNAEKTAEALKDGWFHTGDYGYIRNDEQIVITGRKKNIIVLNNGKNIYPEEIEEKIKTVEGVTEVVVKSLTNQKGEEYALQAEIYSENNTPKEQLFDEIRKATVKMPIYKQIAKITVRPQPFDKTTTQKIKR